MRSEGITSNRENIRMHNDEKENETGRKAEEVSVQWRDKLADANPKKGRETTGAQETREKTGGSRT